MSENYRSRQERKQRQNQSKKPDGTKKKIKKKSLAKKIFMTLGIITLLAILAGGITVFAIIKNAPELDPDKLKLAQNPQIFDNDGELITILQAAENRRSADIDEVPDVLKDAVLSVEDIRFYDHFGLDLRRIGGAIISNITSGFGSEGASTITQQVVKNLFLSMDKTWTRKLQEQYLAIRLEQKYTKDQILEMYLNAIYYSDSRYGVVEAADYYFSKELSELTIEDAALLAGIPQRPNYYNPFNNPEAAETRRNTVISLMEKYEKISTEDAEAARNVPIEEQLQKSEREAHPYQAFIDQVLNEVEAIDGIEASDIYTTGLKIYTTLDQDLQKHVEHVMQSGDVIEFPDDKYQAGITLMDTKTGEVLAIGGFREPAEGVRSWNWATNPRRSPGSSIKPILDYGPAVDKFKWSTYQQLVDEPHTYSDGTPVNNYDRQYLGTISMRKAMETSRNVPAVKAFQEVGIEDAKKFGEQLGLELDEIQEAYSIGGFATGVSSFQMAGAYGAFGNNGVYNEPHTVTKIEFLDGHVIDLTPEPVVAMNDYTAFIVTDVMKTVVEGSEGTGRLAAVPGVPIAGKTGSSNYSEEEKQKYNIQNGIKDSWFVGYSTELTASVWTGYANNEDGYIDTSSGSTEGQIARLLFKEVMTYAHEGREAADFEMPDSVVKVGIERSTGLLPSDFTPSSEIIYEYFVRGTEPTKESEEFITADSVQSLNAAYREEEHAIYISWNYPEEYRDLFSFKLEVQSGEGGDFTTLDVTNDMQYVINNPDYGTTYTIRVTAVSNSDEGLTSDPASVQVTVPEEEIDGEDDDSTDEEEQNEEETPPEQEETPPDDNEDDGETNDDGNGDDNTNEDNGTDDESNGDQDSDDLTQAAPYQERFSALALIGRSPSRLTNTWSMEHLPVRLF
ncbi:penicillin-binding protein 1A [Evansella caseinilytica]|uniref:Penicillin-binding protein 1A n=1 Tax=Evansella caseinilytica TaxID=1503961 RepID=A0A1H3NIC6_9BACI|nr:penicillin-binding protein 1A [Evansella caseinilytica]SDY88632.1 penicillin-binding protein 1A [Evansella caseinilytica]